MSSPKGRDLPAPTPRGGARALGAAPRALVSLRALLDDGARFAPEYAGDLSNHLPMALVALKALGADNAGLAAFAQGYRRRLLPAPPPEAWPAGEPWPARLGDPAAWPVYRGLFAEWLDLEGSGARTLKRPARKPVRREAA